MKPKDVYKLIYQGVFGVGHILGPEALDFLRDEVERIDLNDLHNEKWVESLPPDGSMVRVNLRPHMRKGLDQTDLYKIMKTSVITRDSKDFFSSWDLFVKLVMEKKTPFDRSEVRELDLSIDLKNPAPMHHTDVYREAYKPAYRVVLLDKLKIVYHDPPIS